MKNLNPHHSLPLQWWCGFFITNLKLTLMINKNIIFQSNGQAGSSFQAVPARPAPYRAPCP
ncbi:MAG: hypothetical protein J6W52_06700, partial [Bacteroidaceae bacterium]|nr:hypothetical protein [Bacteroidaceae bacterium]